VGPTGRATNIAALNHALVGCDGVPRRDRLALPPRLCLGIRISHQRSPDAIARSDLKGRVATRVLAADGCGPRQSRRCGRDGRSLEIAAFDGALGWKPFAPKGRAASVRNIPIIREFTHDDAI
jgi:hypothetical protein